MDNEIISWILSVVFATALFALFSFIMVAIMNWPETALVLGVLLFIGIFSVMIHDVLS